MASESTAAVGPLDTASPGGSRRGENPLWRIAGDQGFVVLDGGLATTLEQQGVDAGEMDAKEIVEAAAPYFDEPYRGQLVPWFRSLEEKAEP